MTIKQIMRYESINFLDTAPSTEVPVYALMNKGIESASVSSNATVNERTYIADKNASSSVTSLAKTLDVTQFAYKGDAVFDFVDDLFFKDEVGDGLKSNILQVFLYKSTGLTDVPAKLTPCIIQPDTHGGDGGEQLELAYNVLFSGDSVLGKVTLTDGVPVFTPDAVIP